MMDRSREDRYEKLGKVGEGTFGVVYRVRHRYGLPLPASAHANLSPLDVNPGKASPSLQGCCSQDEGIMLGSSSCSRVSIPCRRVRLSETCICRETGGIFAIKKIRMGRAEEGVSMSAIDEIAALQELEHPNIITLHEVFMRK